MYLSKLKGTGAMYLSKLKMTGAMYLSKLKMTGVAARVGTNPITK